MRPSVVRPKHQLTRLFYVVFSKLELFNKKQKKTISSLFRIFFFFFNNYRCASRLRYIYIYTREYTIKTPFVFLGPIQTVMQF